ncbi:unnamed protein product [Brachionus calyciflorus]|uniref:CDK5 regulatory subunit associated protein 3 n=1 Tax=Brachionus calyciflorus TaxID=104777 RepID=A0A813N6P8_9BILA|nr:unnamed protein product [Brachionus calyciflorus]
MDSQLPIDIHLTKLLDWILDRRHCPRDWQKNVLPVRNKINQAIQDMPEHPEITSLLSGSSIHYFNCTKIVEILKETEKESKNIFGMYSSQRMKDWNNIVSLYQKNNVYLAEAASILQRNVAYEIPALKKQINKSQQLQTECDEKFASLTKSINEVNHQIKQNCSELGIQGENISKELKELPKQLTNIFNDITRKCSSLDKIYKFYCDYVEYFFQRKDSEALCILGYLIKKGNTTVYEWRTGFEPKVVEKPEIAFYNFGDEEEKSKEEETIDFGDFSIDTNNIQLDTLETNGDGIDWGDFEVTTENAENQLETIDYDIDALKSEITVENTGVYVPSDGIAKDTDAFTILEWAETRSLLLNDLVKLATFLKQKLNEMETDSDNLIISTIMQDAPKSIQSFTEKDIQKSLELVKDVLNFFKTKKVEQLIRINDSPNFLKRLYDQFVSKRKSVERFAKSQEQSKQKQKDLIVEENDLNEKLKLIVKKTKELQKFVCEDLSKKYNGVRINLMGEINLI